MKNIKFHYAWWILLVCCAIQAGSQGTIFDTSGVFNSPVCTECKFELGKFTLAQTFSAIMMMITQPLTTKFYERYGLKKVLLISGCIYYLSYFLLSSASMLWHWYLLLAVQGIMGGFFYRTSYTILLCKWFFNKTALALGIATAIGSVMGMIMNPVASLIISFAGWRICYMVLSILGAIITLPLIKILVVENPSKMGVNAYVDEKKSGTVIVFKSKYDGRKEKIVSLLLVLAASICFLCGGYYSHLPNYSKTIGMTAVAGSLLTSFELGGTMIIKFLIGPIYEKKGIIKCEMILAILSMIGFLAYFIFKGPILYLTTSLCGIYCATNVILMPLLAREEIGEEKFQKILPWMATTGAALSSLSNSLYGIIYDVYESYDLMFILCLISIFCSFAFIIVIKVISTNQSKENML